MGDKTSKLPRATISALTKGRNSQKDETNPLNFTATLTQIIHITQLDLVCDNHI